MARRKAAYALGSDCDMNPVRALIVDLTHGREIGPAIASHSGGESGILLDRMDLIIRGQWRVR